MRSVTSGERVIIHFSQLMWIDGDDRLEITGLLTNMPSGQGDYIHMKTDEGGIYAFNPLGNIDYIERLKEEDNGD